MFMLEVRGPQDDGSSDNVPFDIDAVQLALELGIEVASRGTIRGKESAIINDATIQILKTMWVVGYPNAISPSIIGELKVRRQIWGGHWEVIHDGNATKTTIVEA